MLAASRRDAEAGGLRPGRGAWARLPRRSSSPAPACAIPKSRSAAICSPARPASARPRRRASSRPSLGLELTRFDMSEYMERHTVSRLIGAPPGYVGFDQGGLLTDAIDQHPALRAAARRDREGASRPVQHPVAGHGPRQADRPFRQADRLPQCHPDHDDQRRRGRIWRSEAFGFHHSKREGDDTEAINRLFSPEFRNRLDAIVPFGRLPEEVIAQVVDKFILQLEAQLADRNVTIELADEARAWLVKNGYDEAMGARPMARVIQTQIKTPLADEVLFGRLKNGGVVRVVVTAEDDGRQEARLRLSRRAGAAAAGARRHRRWPQTRRGRAGRAPDQGAQAGRGSAWRRVAERGIAERTAGELS